MIEKTEETYKKLLQEFAAGLNISYGRERSVKISKKRVFNNRFLLSFHKKGITWPKLSILLKSLNLPDTFFPTISELFSQTNFIHLGFEETECGCICKVYFESTTQFKNALKERDLDPVLVHTGLKWNPENPSFFTTTYYYYHPLQSQTQIKQKLIDIYSGNPESITLQSSIEIATTVCKRINPEDIIFMIVNEKNNHRNSFDINTYDASLLVADIRPSLTTIFDIFDIPAYQREIIPWDKQLGHISGGLNRSGNEFFTFYFGAESA